MAPTALSCAPDLDDTEAKAIGDLIELRLPQHARALTQARHCWVEQDKDTAFIHTSPCGRGDISCIHSSVTETIHAHGAEVLSVHDCVPGAWDLRYVLSNRTFSHPSIAELIISLRRWRVLNAQMAEGEWLGVREGLQRALMTPPGFPESALAPWRALRRGLREAMAHVSDAELSGCIRGYGTGWEETPDAVDVEELVNLGLQRCQSGRARFERSRDEVAMFVGRGSSDGQDILSIIVHAARISHEVGQTHLLVLPRALAVLLVHVVPLTAQAEIPVVAGRTDWIEQGDAGTLVHALLENPWRMEGLAPLHQQASARLAEALTTAAEVRTLV